jgi:hypothetical protein
MDIVFVKENQNADDTDEMKELKNEGMKELLEMSEVQFFIAKKTSTDHLR